MEYSSRNRRSTESERPQLFVELYELQHPDEEDTEDQESEVQWRETGRWMKYEEAVEAPNNEFGRPKVAPLSFKSLNQLRRLIENGTVLLNSTNTTFYHVCEEVTRGMVQSTTLSGDRCIESEAAILVDILLRSHTRAHDTRASFVPELISGVGTSARRLSHAAISATRRRSRVGSSRVAPQRSVTPAPRTGQSSLSNMISNAVRMGPAQAHKRLSARHSYEPRKKEQEQGPVLARARPRSKSVPSIWSVRRGSAFDYKTLDDTSGIQNGACPNRQRQLSPCSSGQSKATAEKMSLREQPSSATSASDKSTALSRSSRDFQSTESQDLTYLYGDRRSSKSTAFDRVPEGSESAQVFAASVPGLTQTRFGMVRLLDPTVMPELLDAQIPIRMMVFILGPTRDDIDYHEVGRSLCSLISNEAFREPLYDINATSIDIIKALDDFVDCSAVVPPIRIADKNLLKVADLQKAVRKRQKVKQRRDDLRRQSHVPLDLSTIEETNEVFVPRDAIQAVPDQHHVEIAPQGGPPSAAPRDPLKRRGVPFYGLYMDLKDRLPFYHSDFRDALNPQCVTSLFFMFFAAFAPAIAFGGILSEMTEDHMGISETLIAQGICGIIWGLFSTQPLLIVAATGPVFVFEGALFEICKQVGFDFLSFRVWVALWIVVIAVVVVCLEAPFLIRYVTRFTEDIFALLISIIFIKQSLGFMCKNFTKYHPVQDVSHYCCESQTFYRPLYSDGLCNATSPHNPTNSSPGHDPSHCGYDRNHHAWNMPDTSLLSAVLLLATFVLSYGFKLIRTSHFFGRQMRNALGDFGVPISIIIVGLFDLCVFTKPHLQRLDMPPDIDVTCDGRSWAIDPMGWEMKLPVYAIFVAIIPAFLVFILLFVETEITQLLLGKPDKGLAKGSGGFHWDMLLVSLCTLLCSFFGFPWMCAAAVQSLAHAGSLSVMNKVAPGERPTVKRVIEQRVTTIGVAILVGVCAFMGKILSRMPIAILFGVFLYLGVINMQGIQFLKRLILLIVPKKHFPDAPYCKNIGILRMHLYTVIQAVCFITVFLVKYYHDSAIAFPLVMMLICGFRLVAIPRIFTKNELKAVDGEEDEEVENLDEDSIDLYQEAHGFGM